MNFQPMQAPVYSSTAQMLQEAQERKRRLWGSQKRETAPTPAIEPVEKPVMPAPVFIPIEVPFRGREYDHHIHHWKMWKARCFTPMGRVLAEYCAQKGWPIDWIETKSRREEVVHARQEMMYVLRNHYKVSLPRIGKIMGGLDHTTVLYGEKQHRMRLEKPDPKTLIRAPGEDLKHSGVKGITWSRRGRKWEVRLKDKDKVVYLGRFKILSHAVKVCNDYREQMYLREIDGQGT